MKNYLLVLVLLFALPIFSTAQKNINKASGLKSLDEVSRIVMPALDNEALLEKELNRRGPGIAPRFAENIEVDISPSTHGIWETADNGNLVWRLRIYSAGAKSLNLGFSKFLMPKGASLILYAPTKGKVMGPFTPADNEEHEELWTPIINGDEVVIEVQVSAAEQSNLQLQLKSVNHDFVGFAEMSVISGSCNLDVICGAADGWEIVDGFRDIIRSVAVISTGGTTFCTGFLVNNVNNDCTPYFMTANHCGINSSNDASLVTYWNFENSTCRQPGSSQSGGNGNGQLNDFNTGSIHRASYSPSDFTLVELDDPVSETANAYFAGWSAVFVMPQDTVITIHHPSTDEKRISFEFNPTQPGLDLSNNIVPIAQADHIIIPDWDIGTTEGGSSGAPLFNNQKQVVGQLHGGSAACGNNAYDTYGWFNTSWDGGGSSSNALRFWLDPNDTGVTNISGKDCSFSISVDPPFQELCAPADALVDLYVAENFGSDVTISAANIPAGTTVTFSPNPVPPNGTAEMLIANTGAVASGQYTIQINGTDGVDQTTSFVILNILAGAPTNLTQLVPANGALGTVTAPIFSWDESTGGADYLIDIATDTAFTNIVETASGFTTPSYNGNFLNTLTTYYWRVKGSNLCGEGPWSTVWNFTTADIACGAVTSTDVPVDIGGGPPSTVISTLSIATTGLITDINLSNLDISHSYVGDLSASLQSPAGTVIQLFDEPGGGNCSENNLSVSFDDNANNTANDFVNTCDPGAVAISGVFQPAELLAGLVGEDPNGIWTLTVVDDAGQDGGTITGWDIDICTSIPLDLSLSPSSSQLSGCVDQLYNFDLIIGSDFEPNGATLSVAGNPAGSTVEFTNNPGVPGSMVGVIISGVNTVGTYTLTFTADDGVNSTDATVTILVVDTPAAPALVFPANAEMNIVLSPTLQWNAAIFANSYAVDVATDAAFTNIIASTGTTLLNYSIPLALDFGTEYFWRVFASGDCGDAMSSINSFTTVPDLVVTVSPNSETACISEEAIYEITVGAGFTTPTMISYSISPSVGINVSYDVDPNDVTPGSTVTATFTDLINAAPANYNIIFTVADAINSITATSSLQVEGPPALSSLSTPANGAVNQMIVPSFSWAAVVDADSYLVEVASDQLFTDIIEMQTTTLTNYTLPAPLAFLTTYYWRVSAENECGGSLTEPFSFTTEMEVAVDELEGNAFSIMPNPTTGHLDIVFAQALNKGLTVEVYAIDGKLLQQHRYESLVEQLPIELADYASGVYVVRLVTAKAAVARRITLQK